MNSVKFDLIKPGDIVKLEVQQSNSQKTYEGIVLPRNELFNQDILVLKMESGYNIGLQKKKITKITKKGTVSPPQKPLKVKQNPNLSKVAVLSFGGTISSRLDYKTGGVIASYSAEDFVLMIPELHDIAQVEANFCDQIMSEDARPQDWVKMSTEITKYLNREDIAGVVVTHGTDTMHYSASAVSFMLGKLNKPVIFTGSQRSIDRGSSDAFENLLCAIQAAVNWDGAEVVVCMHETTNDGSCLLSRGVKVRKMHTSRRDAFRPINEQPLARIQPQKNIEILNQKYDKRSNHIVLPLSQFEEKIGLVYVYPGIDEKQIEFFLKEKYKGLVIGATALGHVPQNLLPILQNCVEANMIVVIATQTLYGKTHEFVYSRLREESIELGLVFAKDVIPETAYTKLGWLLSQTHDVTQTKKLFLQNMKHEFAQEIDVNSYLN